MKDKKIYQASCRWAALKLKFHTYSVRKKISVLNQIQPAK